MSPYSSGHVEHVRASCSLGFLKSEKVGEQEFERNYESFFLSMKGEGENITEEGRPSSLPLLNVESTLIVKAVAD